MKTSRKLFWLLFILLFISCGCYAGIRSKGKYSGVVVFDRWGSCTLYSGIYLMYISEQVKKELLPFQNKAIQINATKVFQVMNPGDGLIKEFEYLGDAPADANDENTTSLQLKTWAGFQDGNQPRITIEVANNGKKEIEVYSGALAPTLLTNKFAGLGFLASDGPSFAILTRQSFWLGDEARWQGKSMLNGQLYEWSIGEKQALPRQFELRPHQKRQIHVSFTLPAGEYDFLCGYGGGVHESVCIASNLTSFDVNKEGQAKIIARNAP